MPVNCLASSMIGSSQISLADDNLIPEAIPEPKAPLAVFTHPTPTPSTATNTISVDGFFEPPTYAHRGSLHPPHFSPTDESFPVFSPPPTRIGAGVQMHLERGDRRCFSSTTQSPALSHHTCTFLFLARSLDLLSARLCSISRNFGMVSF